MKVSALFAGIAGLELGLERAGHETLMFCEISDAARAVLSHHFPDIPLKKDVCDLEKLPLGTELVTAGFPCQNLSQAGDTTGITGAKSGVVAHLFRLLRRSDIPTVLIENVPFMLYLRKGQAMRYLVESLESLGYDWAYRVVDARAFGLPQRRERVFLLASKVFDPRVVLFHGNRPFEEPKYEPGLACGFYWTEGNRGLGWAVDAVPTLKGGSTHGIPSPPAIWMPDGRIVKPDIRDAERLQGFPVDWTRPVEKAVIGRHRWTLVGNSVSVRASQWIGRRLANHSRQIRLPRILRQLNGETAWPNAAFGSRQEGRYSVELSKWPCLRHPSHLASFLKYEPEELSLRAISGFRRRLNASNLKSLEEFRRALGEYEKWLRESIDVAHQTSASKKTTAEKRKPSDERPPASSPSVRKRMRATPQKDNPNEKALRTELHRMGLRYRIHRRIIPGLRRTADLIFPGARVAVFVDGCFWHGCPQHATLPEKTNRAFWTNKIEENQRRDRDTNTRLARLGWQVIRVWEHEDVRLATSRIARSVRIRMPRTKMASSEPTERVASVT